jgi:hypothetical protein
LYLLLFQLNILLCNFQTYYNSAVTATLAAVLLIDIIPGSPCEPVAVLPSTLIDIILGEVESPCGYEASDMNSDGHVNILDVIRVVQLLINGTEQQAIIFLDDILTPIKFTKLIHELPTNYFVSNEIIVWPNPFNNLLNINGSGHTEIYNLMGKKIKQINLNGTYRWNTSDLSSGIYKIINNKKTTTITLVK